MGSKIDITGRRFGKLLVLYEEGRNKHKQVLWRCKCDCGNEILSTSTVLLYRNRQSCGCYNNSLKTEQNYRKVCSACKIEKDVSEFSIIKITKLGFKTYNSKCKKCSNEYNRKVVREKINNKRCVICGEKLSKNRKATTCIRCRNITVFLWKKRRLEHKKMAVKYLGGKCLHCGLETEFYSIYDFHHKDPKEKDSLISQIMNKKSNFELIKKELDKCELLCSNCHRIVHEKERMAEFEEEEKKIEAMQYNRKMKIIPNGKVI